MKKEMALLVLLSLFTTQSFSVSLRDSVEMALANNPDIIAERKNQEAYRKYVDERKGKYLPTLDLEAYVSEESTNDDRDSVDSDGNWFDKNGYKASIIFRQYLYDGGLTPSQVAETRYQEIANKHRSYYAIENTILETIKTYNSLVESDEKLYLTAGMIKTNEDNLATAKEKEEISGEVLETYQVSSKLNFVTDRYLEEQESKNTKVADYVRYVGAEPIGKVCRPTIDETHIPKTLKDAIELAVLKNHKILEQIQKIKLQREKIAQYDANFLPSLNLELKASIDKDLELDEDGISKSKYARINFNWNLFNGNRDKIKSEQEEIFLKEQKKTLDEITNEVVAEIKSLYSRYYKYKERIKVFSKYVEANMNIVEVYRNEFEAGTRTFVDILNAESEFYESSKNLIELEHSALNNYYDLMFNLSRLSDVILSSSNQDCALVEPRKIEYNPKKQNKDTRDELEGLISKSDSELITRELGLNLDDSKKKRLDEELLEKASMDTMRLVGFKYKSFLDAPKNYFTINLATKNSMLIANKYIKNNNLGENAFAFEFGSNKKSTKILYGIYSSKTEAKKVMKSFNEEVLSAKPYVDNIKKHQTLYSKYNL